MEMDDEELEQLSDEEQGQQEMKLLALEMHAIAIHMKLLNAAHTCVCNPDDDCKKLIFCS